MLILEGRVYRVLAGRFDLRITPTPGAGPLVPPSTDLVTLSQTLHTIMEGASSPFSQTYDALRSGSLDDALAELDQVAELQEQVRAATGVYTDSVVALLDAGLDHPPFTVLQVCTYDDGAGYYALTARDGAFATRDSGWAASEPLTRDNIHGWSCDLGTCDDACQAQNDRINRGTHDPVARQVQGPGEGRIALAGLGERMIGLTGSDACSQFCAK